MSRFSLPAFAPLLALLSVLSGFATANETAAPKETFFDPAKHMRVDEVRSGMRGYGLSVFKGTKIERFEVEVLSVLRDFNPKYDVILVSLKGANLEHTGSIAGMSGSPIYLKDDAGRERMVGAFAYGWPLMKDPVGGVQPIEYMLSISGPTTRGSDNTAPATSAPAPTTTTSVRERRGPSGSAAGSSAPIERTAAPRLRWDLSDVVMLPGMKQPPANWPFASLKTMQPNPRLGMGGDDVTRLRPLATPLMTAGLPPKLLEQLTPIFNAYGLMPLQSGGIGGGRANEANDARLEPGSVMAVPLLTGDLEMTAVGTCTEVLGDRVWGFGHPFQNEGPVSLPVGAGEINGVIANLMTSFKLGALGKTYGTLYADEQVGVAGRLGEAPPMVPINLKVRYADGSGDRDYAFKSAWHPRFTPLLAATALTAAVTGVHELPEFHTLEYDATIEFENGQKIRVANTLVNAEMPELFFEFGTPMMAAAQNPFERVGVKKIEGTVNVSPHARDATILWVNAPRLKFRPGETLKAYVNYRAFRAGDAILPVEFELPRDLPEGTYQLTVSGWEQYLMDERTARPFRFSAESGPDVFAVVREMLSIRHDAVYLRLLRQPDGIAIGRTAMPSLPSSRREVLLGAGRSNTTPFVSSTTKVLSTEHLMSGAAQFEVTIDKNARVETGAGKPPPRSEVPVVGPQNPAVKSPAGGEVPKPPAKPDVPGIPTPEPGPSDPGASE